MPGSIRVAATVLVIACAGQPGTARGGTDEAPPPSATTVHRRQALRAVVRGGYDVGTRSEATLDAPGGDVRLGAGSGLWFAAGVRVTPVDALPLELEATVGLKHAAVRSGGSGLAVTAVPVDLLAAWRVGALRLGGGLRLALAQRLRGDGALAWRSDRPAASLGPVLAAEAVPSQPEGWPTVSLGVRAAWLSYRSSTGVVHSASTLGLSAGLAF